VSYEGLTNLILIDRLRSQFGPLGVFKPIIIQIKEGPNDFIMLFCCEGHTKVIIDHYFEGKLGKFNSLSLP
jgi:hypothetical protein